MKKIILLSSLFAFSPILNAQKPEVMNTQTGVITCESFSISKPLSELAITHPLTEKRFKELQKENIRESKDREHRKPQKFKYSAEKDGPAYGNDLNIIQTEMGKNTNKAPIMNFAGQNATGFRPMDPSGAASTTYYMQAINSTTYTIYNKATGATVLSGSVGSLWSPATPNDGDPIIMYDRYADRWFVSQFGSSGNKIYIAISTTNNPTGTYYTYTFTSPQFPDYLKFSIWQDGYYMTSNQGTQKVFAFQRSAMLTGSPTAKVVYTNFTPPTGGGFFCPMPGDADGNGGLPPAGTPCPIFTYTDNAWGGGVTDAIRVYSMTVNWVPATPTATIALTATLNTAAFDASYDASWNDVSQPGTTQKLDGIGGVLQYRAQWRNWSTYRTTVLNWPVKISATQRSIMWAELRQDATTGVWSIYQQSIYAPDTKTRWMGSIAMADNGGIALCYARCSTTAGDYMGLYYAGRKVCDPLNTLPVTEQVAIAGTGAQTGGVNRDGDYAQTALDPDGVTFWYTGEYMGGATGGTAARTRIYSFQLPVCAAVAPVAAFTGTPTTVCAGGTVTFTDNSTNTPTSWLWSFPGGTPNSSTLQNPVVTYNTPGTYNVTLTSTNGAGSSAPVTMTGYITVNAVPAAPTAGSSSPDCTGQTINLTANTVAGATYAWTGPSSYTSTLEDPTRPSATAAMAGTYSVTVTVAGCTSLAGTTTVVVNPTPATPTATNTGPYCAGATIQLNTATVAGATYAWTGPGGYTSSSEDPTRPTSTTAMAGTYSLTVTVGGCTSLQATTTVVVNAVPAAPTAGNGGPYCAGATINLTSNTVAGATYAWTGPGGYTSTLEDPTRPTSTTAMAGTYSVTVTVAGCTSLQGTTTVVVNPAPATPTATNTGPYCAGSTIQLNTATVAGATYAWTGPGGYTSALEDPTRPTATTAMSGTYSLTVTVGGCTSLVGTTAVTVNPNPTVTVNSPTICPGGTAALTASGASTYSWSAGATSTGVNTANASPSSTTTYTVTGTDANGCVGTAVSTVTIGSSLSVTVNSPTICAGETATLTAGGGTTYTWSAGATPTGATTADVTPSTTTSYTVTGTSGGCTGTGVSTVTVNPTPSAPVISLAGGILTSSSPTGNQWYLNGVLIVGATGQNYTFTANGNYTCVVTSGGCSSVPSNVVTITTTGISDLTSNPLSLNIFPNPNDGNFNVTFNALKQSNYIVELHNALGQIVYREVLNDFSGTYMKKMSVIDFGKGVYTLTLTDAEHGTVKKVIVY